MTGTARSNISYNRSAFMWGWHTYASVNDHISVVFCYQNIRETELLIASNNAILYTRDLHLIPLSGNPNV